MAKHFTLPYEGGLIEKDLPAGILHNYEKIWTHVFPDSHPATYEIADTIIAAIKAKKDGLFRLGLTTGVTPVTLYRVLARRHHEGEFSFKNVEIVSIDEYYPSSKKDAQSRNHILHEVLIDDIDILKENVHIPDGTVPAGKVSDYCVKYDEIARNLDLLVITRPVPTKRPAPASYASPTLPESASAANSTTTSTPLRTRPSPLASAPCSAPRRLSSWHGARTRPTP